MKSKVLALTLSAAVLFSLLVGCSGTQNPSSSSSLTSSTSASVSSQSSSSKLEVTENSAKKYNIIDSHLHYLDFLQKTDGFESLITQMDIAGVSKAVTFGMAMAKQWDENTSTPPSYYLSNDSRSYYYSATDYIFLEQLSKQPQEIKDRILPFVCGVNLNDRYSVDHIKELLELYPNQIVGIGEIMSRHDDLTALTYGEPPHADHPATLSIVDFAAEQGLPVLIHHNVSNSYGTEPIYGDEMKNLLAHNRNTNIIWAHVGISRRIDIPNLIELTDQNLSENSNLYVDLSWVVFDDYIAKSDESLQQWAALIEKYPNRIMIGSDIVGHWNKYSSEIQKYYKLLDLLQEDTANKVCSENILNLVKKY